jgi:tetratricopeptide (TPR) repeat protein
MTPAMSSRRLINLFTAVFLLFIAIQFPVTALAENPDHGQVMQHCITSNEQFNFAEQLFSKGEFDQAAIEYQRFILFFPDDNRVMTARLQMGKSYFEKGDYDRAKTVFLEIIALNGKENQTPSAFFELSRCFFMLGDVKNALSTLNGLILQTDNPDIIDRAWYEMGWISLESQGLAKSPSWQDAEALFKRISPANKDPYGIDALLLKMEDSRNIPRKSPTIAGFLSIIPGGGYFYCNRYQDALTAFLLNSGLILAAVSSFENDNPALGAVIGFVEAGFYSGNIYGGISSAHKYNRNQTRRFIEILKDQTAIRLSANGGQQKLAVFFHMNF